MYTQDEASGDYGIDWDAPLSTEDDLQAVHMNRINNPLTEDDFIQLCELVNPCTDDGNHGIFHYLTTLSFTENKLARY